MQLLLLPLVAIERKVADKRHEHSEQRIGQQPIAPRNCVTPLDPLHASAGIARRRGAIEQLGHYWTEQIDDTRCRRRLLVTSSFRRHYAVAVAAAAALEHLPPACNNAKVAVVVIARLLDCCRRHHRIIAARR